ncbi:hypothetical protein [Mycolicibacterium fortuitum]|uniref:hypothetical protein n=1 Tax=Mycolicibacterium fortuitum TaxID=1766 RepID=UPI001F16C3BA|nr:hypothetical protein [Mycolicibacterium fortuitum]
MALHLLVILRSPGQAADANDQLEFLAVVRGLQVDREQVFVDVANRGVTAFPVGPQTPVDQPALEGFADLGVFGELYAALDHLAFVIVALLGRDRLVTKHGLTKRRLLLGIVDSASDPDDELVRQRWRVQLGHPVHGQQRCIGGEFGDPVC